MNILHASTDPALLDRLRQMLGSSQRADIAVGYFFMSGFGPIAQELGALEKIRLLVGRTDRQVLDHVAAGLQQAQALRSKIDQDSMIRRRDRDQLAAESVAQIGGGVGALPQTDESEISVSALRDLVSNNTLEIRTYPRGPLHAKAYLCWYDPSHAEPGSAVVGSSNFTLAGFTGNTELNVRVTGDAEMSELRRWFDELWSDSVDITDDVLVELDQSWVLAKTPPYHVYLKALHELYGEEIGSGEPPPLPLRDPALANFQLDAVSQALRMIDAHGGCYVSDVVGLGKTFVGAEILRQLQFSYPHDGQPLIICPAGLVPMWRKTNEQFGLGAEVVSHSMISPPHEQEFDEEEGRYVDIPLEGQRGIVLQEEFPNRGPVLVDEAHNFRNLNARSAGLRSYLEAGDHKTVLMSATPQNLGPRDIYRQINLFLDEVDHGLNIEPLGLEDYFRAIEQWHNYRADFENWQQAFRTWQRTGSVGPAPVPPKEPTTPRARIETVLTPVVVRRRRRDIRELYGDTAEINGEPVHFPDPVLENLNYRLDQVYKKAGPFDDLKARLEDHRAARYRVTDYLLPKAIDSEKYQDLWRARDRIARLMGALLFKRLESSVEAFRATLRSLITSNRNFKEALEEGFVPIGQTATRLLAGEAFDADELMEILEQEQGRRRGRGPNVGQLVHTTDDFDVDRWVYDLDADHAILDGLLALVSSINPEDDDKLQALKRFLSRADVKSGKVLIFSEAETTVEYLSEQLNPGGRDPEIARLSGANRNQTQDIIKRFAPNSNLGPRERMPGSSIRVLIATDVISEGQNLQDCARVLNYDLHWNPIRLVQRFGRVDRIGSTHDVINLHNMWPDLALDENLNLTERLLNRIQMFHDFIGLDSRLLSDSERLNTDAMYRIYEERTLPDSDDGLDEVAAHQRGIALLQRIQESDPDLWDTITSLPDGIRAALTVGDRDPNTTDEAGLFTQTVLEIEGAQMPMMSPEDQVGVASPFDSPIIGESVVLLKTGDVASAYAVGDDLNSRSISAAQFIQTVQCEPDTPGSPLPENTNDRVMAAFDQFTIESRAALGRSRRPSSDTRVRRYISRQLNIAREQYRNDSDELRRIELLRRIFPDHVTPRVIAALREAMELRVEGAALIRRLEALRARYRLSPPDEDGDSAGSEEAKVIRIVCSDGLVD